MNNISLLPPEIKAQHQTRRQLKIYILCSCLALIIFLGIYVWMIYLTNQQHEDVCRLQEQKAKLQQEAVSYQKYGDLKNRVDALEKMNNQALGVTPNWYFILAEVGNIPDGLWLTDYTASYKIVEKEKSKDEKGGGPSQGELTIRGKAFTHKQVASLLVRMHKIPGLEDIRCHYSEEKDEQDQQLMDFEIIASLPVQKGGK